MKNQKKVKKSFRELSNSTCITCNRHLKQNLVDKIPFAKYCWKHWKSLKKVN